MNDAIITVEIDGEKYTLKLSNINLDEKRDKLALNIGRAVVDTIWAHGEGK